MEYELHYGCSPEEGAKHDARHILLVVETMGRLWAETYFGCPLDMDTLRRKAAYPAASG